MIDFDGKFHAFYEKWINDNAGKYTFDELEDKVAEVYELWISSPDEELGGLSPEAWIAERSAAELVGYLIESIEKGEEVDSLLIDAIELNEECYPELCKLLSCQNDQIKIHVANMLIETEKTDGCLDSFVKWLCDSDCNAELRDLAVDALKGNSEQYKEQMFAACENADENTKTLIAEVLITLEKDEKTFELLKNLFITGQNLALYAGYFGKYGDERAATLLYKALDNCNYLEFTEIRNAIEVLGGTVDDEYRDFSDDEYYKAIKNLK